MKSYNATAEVSYKSGMWKGSFGLPTLYNIQAPSKASATKFAKTYYMTHPDMVDALSRYKSVKMHLSVEESY